MKWKTIYPNLKRFYLAKEFKKGYRIIRKNKALQGMDQESMKGGGVENINLLGSL